MVSAIKSLIDGNDRQVAKLRRLAVLVNGFEPRMEALSDDDLRGQTAAFRERLSAGETLDDLLPEAFAAAREAAKRTLGQRPFDVQIMGAASLHQGMISEMKTGEGKTLTATLALYLNALEGKGAHLVTTNDFLVRWQAQWMSPIFEALGMTVGWVQHDMSPAERHAMYVRDVTYVQNAELGFDYLRDNMANSMEELVLRDLNFAIVDEVDSILVDEARTPLIISGPSLRSSHFFVEIDRVVRRLKVSSGPEPEQHDGDYFFDEKTHQAALTEPGTEKVEKILGIDNLADPEYIDIVHHLNAAIKAHTLFKREDDYIVKEGEVIIVDEYTGHLQPGRRYSDGLHEAIEAKEGVRVQRQFQTIATITYQNLFRLYNKLAGMTGTAKTEETEFRTIYGMGVICIPTNRTVIRRDHPDVIYQTQEQKYRGIVGDILSCYLREQPVLVGTRSVETSEYLATRLKPDKLGTHCLMMLCYDAIVRAEDAKSQEPDKKTRDEVLDFLRSTPLEEMQRPKLRQACKRLGLTSELDDEDNIERLIAMLEVEDEETKARRSRRYRERLAEVLLGGIPHNILNAKYHEQEGQIIADAGRPGAVTIATNMAGRGVDIVLGGRPEDPSQPFNPDLYEKVKAVGGLHILGTERHESRRIDNQLRGRGGRQGDPGSSRFYIALEDDLMRLFGPERFGFLMKGWPAEEPIEHKLVTGAIERAQKKVEARNFERRKQTLKYDDVMNKHREIIYRERRRVLLGEDIRDSVLTMIQRTVDRIVGQFASPAIHPDDRNLPALWEELQASVPFIGQFVTFEAIEECHPRELPEIVANAAVAVYQAKEGGVGRELMAEIERTWLLRIVNQQWMGHLQDMDYIMEGIHLRAYGQIDPLIAYQKEASEYFDALLDRIAADTIRAIILTEVVAHQEAVDHSTMREVTQADEVEVADDRPRVSQHRTDGKTPGRNDPCPCGSGQKYKNCCMHKQAQKPAARR